MRTKEEILKQFEWNKKELFFLEVLCDIRDELNEINTTFKPKKKSILRKFAERT